MTALIEAKRAGLFGRPHIANNVGGGVISVPLVTTFAIASDGNSEQGVYTTIIAGFLGSICGGSRLRIPAFAARSVKAAAIRNPNAVEFFSEMTCVCRQAFRCPGLCIGASVQRPIS